MVKSSRLPIGVEIMYRAGAKFIILLISYILFFFNNNFVFSNEHTNKLKIGLLLPLSGEYKEIGESLIYSSLLAVKEIDDKNIELVVKDIGSDNQELLVNALDTLNEEEIFISIILTDTTNYSILHNYQDVIFLSLSNKSSIINKNIINFGVNLTSQLDRIFSFLEDQKMSKIIVLYPEGVNEELYEVILKNFDEKIFKKLKYSNQQSKLNDQIEKLTLFNQRKINLNARIKQLENLEDDPQAERELKKLETLDTLGNLNFDSVIVLDFGNSLKSVLSTLAYVDAGSDRITIATINQWFDESLFLEKTSSEIYFPSIDLVSFKNFNKDFNKNFNKQPFEISILAYDAIAYIYHIWQNEKQALSMNSFKLKSKIKGRSGSFFINNDRLLQDLTIYKVSNDSFKKF